MPDTGSRNRAAAFHPFRSRFPLRWRFRSSGVASSRRRTDQVGVSEALPDQSLERVNEPRHVFGLAVVEPVYLFVEVAEQMERLDADVGALDRPLEQGPEVFQAV